MTKHEYRELLDQIASLREELAAVAAECRSLTSPDVLRISRQLDRLLLIAQKCLATDESDGLKE